MNKELICWDASAMIAWINEEVDRIEDVEAVVQKIEQGHYNLVVSTLIYPEVVETTMPVAAIEKFNRFIQRREIITVLAVNTRIAKKAQEIRNRTSLKTPDAIHAATAIINGATVLHTFDDDLLNLTEAPEIDGPAVTECSIPGVTG